MTYGHLLGANLRTAHDFFTPQPPREAPSIYVLRFILHDWADSYAIKILKHLRATADSTKTRLMIIERVIPYACKADDKLLAIPGAAEDLGGVPTPPLLPNMGIVSRNGYLTDIMVRVFCAACWNGRSSALHADVGSR